MIIFIIIFIFNIIELIWFFSDMLIFLFFIKEIEIYIKKCLKWFIEINSQCYSKTLICYFKNECNRKNCLKKIYVLLLNKDYKICQSSKRLDYIVNSRNEISSTMSQRRSELFKDYSRTILRVNRLSKFNDRDGNLKVIRFLTQFDLNIHNRTQSFITMINLNDTNRHVAYLVHIMLIVYWLNRKHSMLNAMIVISEILSKKFIWYLFYVCELLSKTYLNSFQMKSI